MKAGRIYVKMSVTEHRRPDVHLCYTWLAASVQKSRVGLGGGCGQPLPGIPQFDRVFKPFPLVCRFLANYRVAFTGALFETVTVEDSDMPTLYWISPACCTLWASTDTAFSRTPSMCERNSWVRMNVSLPIMS